MRPFLYLSFLASISQNKKGRNCGRTLGVFFKILLVRFFCLEQLHALQLGYCAMQIGFQGIQFE